MKENKSNIQILLVTTKGCRGCQIMNTLINEVVNKFNVVFDIVDFKYVFDVYPNIVNKDNVKDFPTTFFIKDDKITHKIVGTTTKSEISSILTYISQR